MASCQSQFTVLSVTLLHCSLCAGRVVQTCPISWVLCAQNQEQGDQGLLDRKSGDVCVDAYIYICVYIYTNVFLYWYKYINIYLSIFLSSYLSTYVSIYLYIPPDQFPNQETQWIVFTKSKQIQGIVYSNSWLLAPGVGPCYWSWRSFVVRPWDEACIPSCFQQETWKIMNCILMFSWVSVHACPDEHIPHQFVECTHFCLGGRRSKCWRKLSPESSQVGKPHVQKLKQGHFFFDFVCVTVQNLMCSGQMPIPAMTTLRPSLRSSSRMQTMRHVSSWAIFKMKRVLEINGYMYYIYIIYVFF